FQGKIAGARESILANFIPVRPSYRRGDPRPKKPRKFPMSEQKQELSAAPKLSTAERLWRIRHSASHILAQAVLEVFPDAKLAIGPPIANGFYYDFDLPRTLTDDDLADLEERMTRIVKLNAE